MSEDPKGLVCGYCGMFLGSLKKLESHICPGMRKANGILPDKEFAKCNGCGGPLSYGMSHRDEVKTFVEADGVSNRRFVHAKCATEAAK